MFKFAIKAAEGRNYLVGFGITELNLHLIQNDKPILFESKEVGLDVGQILIVYDSEDWKKNSSQIKKHFKGYCFVLGEKEVNKLQSNSSLIMTFNGVDFMFMFGKDEFEFHNRFKSMIGPETKQSFEGWSPTDRHKFGNEN